MRAYIFPGQGTQFPGMAHQLYENSQDARHYFAKASEILEFDIADTMFNGKAAVLKKTNVAQPAIFLHSVVSALISRHSPDMVAGHSLGELSALVVAKVLSFEDGLWLVKKRAAAMQKACSGNSTMAAVLGLDPAIISTVCADIPEGVVPANYNAPQQTVISGTHQGIVKASQLLKEAGAKMVIPLAVDGGFHSSLMSKAKEDFENSVVSVAFHTPICPIYQNVDGTSTREVNKIKRNLVLQLTHPVQWTQTVHNMLNNGASEFLEFGPKKVLSGLVQRIKASRIVQNAA